MIRRTEIRAPRLPASLLAVAALCVAAFGGVEAEASCGDWLEGHAAIAGEAVATTAGAGAAATGRPAAFSDLVPLDRPCDGPACRRAPIAPPVPFDLADPPPPPEQALAGLGPALEDSSGRSAPRPTDAPRLPSADPGLLDRPPRGR